MAYTDRMRRSNARHLQRRHFEFIADVISKLQKGTKYTRWGIAREFAAALSDTSVNFDKARFLRACGEE